MAYETVIGLEVHCQLATKTKLFCGCSVLFGAAPNHQVCEVCLGMPGVLPVLNHQAVDLAVRTALALGGQVQEFSVFARKQYFYPDLPKGYQISQYDRPYCLGGALTLGSGQTVRLTRIHLEEDAGKNVHTGAVSLVDCNRAGTPLMEIVSEPELRSAADAADYLRRLRAIVRSLGAGDGNLEEGSFRCDANVSVREVGATELGTRCEIKNLNSFRYVEKAITYEAQRQWELLSSGQAVRQETRLFDASTGRTETMRTKEDSHDYRYLPDPDLPPVWISRERLALLASSLPELPAAAHRRLTTQLEVSEQAADVLTSDAEVTAFFDQVVGACGVAVKPPFVANWLVAEYLPVANEANWSWAQPVVAAAQVAELLQLVASGVLSGKLAKTVFAAMVQTGGEERPGQIVGRLGLVQISDESAVLALVEQVLASSSAQLEQYLAGKDKLLGFFVGQIMKESRGKMNPEVVNRLLLAALAQRRSTDGG